MGYDIYVMESEKCCSNDGCDDMVEVQRVETGTTFNFNKQYARITGQTLYELLNGKQLKDTIDILSNLVSKLGTTPDPDSWAATPGNAGKRAKELLDLAKKYPDAKWEMYK